MKRTSLLTIWLIFVISFCLSASMRTAPKTQSVGGGVALAPPCAPVFGENIAAVVGISGKQSESDIYGDQAQQSTDIFWVQSGTMDLSEFVDPESQFTDSGNMRSYFVNNEQAVLEHWETNPVGDKEIKTRVVILVFDANAAQSELEEAELCRQLKTRYGATVYAIGYSEDPARMGTDFLQFLQRVSSNNGVPQDPSFCAWTTKKSELSNILQGLYQSLHG